MPTISLNKKEFEKLVGKSFTQDMLKDRIAMIGTDLESIRGNIITVEIFPNRPDMLSEQGFARAFSSFTSIKKGLRKYIVRKSSEKLIVDKSVRDIRPYTACAIVKGLKLDDEKIREIIQIQEKLHSTFGRNRRKVAIGIYPLEKIKFPIRYMAKKPEEIIFQPLESNKVMNANEILKNHSAGKGYGYLLEKLDKYPVFIDSNNEVLSMPPIINSHLTGKITEKTKDVFIECSGFDFNYLQTALNILVTSLADMKGSIYSINLIYSNKKGVTPNLNPKVMKIDIKYVNRLLGLGLKESDVKRYLEMMGYDYKNKKVLIPPYRADILHEIDLVEDIAIAYGYENFKEEIPKVATISEENKFEIFKNKIANSLIGLKLMEVNTYNLLPKEDLMKMDTDLSLIEVSDSKTENTCLRNFMIPSLLKVLQENRHNEYPQNIFEMGTTFKKNNSKETNIEEATRLAVLLCHNKANYTEIKQILDALINSLNLDYNILEVEHNSFIPGRVARISVKNNNIAFLGEIHPAVLERFAIDMPVAALELNLSELFSLMNP